jgi:hypothetical protein
MRADPRLRYPINSPIQGMFLMLLICLEQARKEDDERAFYRIWVDPPKLHHEWLRLREYDMRHKPIEHKDIYFYYDIPHGNVKNKNGRRKRRKHLDNKSERE